MAKKTAPEVKNEQKVQTRYDRKMEARKQKEEREKKEAKVFKIVSSIVAAVLVLALAGGIGISVINKQTALNSTYIKIGDKDVTKVEFDYYYNNEVNNYLTSYSSILPYLGLDTTKDYADQPYTDELSWKDLFDQMTVERISQTFALLSDAEEKGYSYDVTEDYKNRTESIKTAAEAAGMTVPAYYESMYGSYATEKNMEPFIKKDILAAAYYNELIAQNAPSDEEIDAYYEGHKDDYDRVDYRSFAFAADIAESSSQENAQAEGDSEGNEAADAAQEETAAAMKEAKAKADAFMKEREAGSDFEELCIKNASEEEKANYEDAETEYSLSEGRFRTGIPAALTDWLYDDSRAEGDIAVIEDEVNNKYYVVEFIKKYYDENDDANISSTIATERVTEYVDALEENFQVTDVKGKLKYLSVSQNTEETEGTENTESIENAQDTTEDVTDAGDQGQDAESAE